MPCARPRPPASGLTRRNPGIDKIKHVIIIMQENRSFDSYFGTFPGAGRLPHADGCQPFACLDPRGGCTRPYHDRADVAAAGRMAKAMRSADVDTGRMDGFIRRARAARKTCTSPTDPACAGSVRPT